MAYNALNNLIDAYIYANGVQAITGSILNGVLKQMVSQLGSGYHLMGVAGPETVPASNDYAMAYFAATAGEYTDFGGITLAPGEVAVLLTYGNGSWTKQTVYNVPTGTDDLENTANFITNAVTDLVNYYTKTEIDGQKAETDAALSARYTKAETDTKLVEYYKKTETYDKDEVDSIIATLNRQEYIVAWDGLAAPDITAIPAGVTVTYSGTTYTGTLAASASTVNKIYMVWNGTAYDMYGTSQDGGYSWIPMGTTTVDLSQYATKEELDELENKVGDFSEFDEEIFNDVTFTPISGYVWDFAHDVPYESASGSYALVSVSAGEKYKLSGVSLSNAMPGAVLYGNNRTIYTRLITGPSPFVFEDQEVSIPEGYDEMIVNGNTSNPIAIKLGTFVPGSAETAIKAVDKKVDGKIADIARSGSFLVGETSEGIRNYVPFPEFFSKNLLNINDQDVMLGYRQYNDTPEQNSSYNLSGYIPVEAGKNYIYSTSEKTYNDIAYLSVFDDLRGFIRAISGVTTFTPLAGEAFVRITIRTAAWSKEAQFEEGTIPTEYSPYGVGFKYPDMKTPTISMPSKVYVYKGRQNSIYHKNYIDWITDDFVISSYRSYAQATWKFLERCFRATNPTQTIEILLHRVETRKELKQVSVQTVVGDPETDNGNVKVLCIGDSFTYDGRYIKQVSDLCPNITTIGMRTPGQSVASGLKCEGRGGWTLADYSVPFVSTFDSFSPFVQANGYNYYGVTTFWAAVKGTSPDPYRTNGFDASMFDASGYKLNPSVNDLMYDGSNFVAWDGSSWSVVSGDLEFNFDFAKYLSIWGISTPDIVLIFLGKNDFHNGTTGWPTFKSRMDALVESIHSVSANIIVGVCTPTTADEAPNNTDNTNARLAHFNMWDARKLLIENYDGLENDNVFLVDTGTTLDPDYGFVMEEQLPFEYYEGEERILISTNGVHPSGAGYKQIGTCMAGFIQAKR